MVRKSVTYLALACTLAVLLAQPITASAAGYAAFDGNISSTYTNIFRDLVGKHTLFKNYVFFRSNQNEYMLVVGPLTYSGGVFEADSCTVYRIITETAYGSSYSFSQLEETYFSLAPADELVYSNLGHYPDLIDRTDFYAFATLLILLIALFMYLLRSIFSFTLRRIGR